MVIQQSMARIPSFYHASASIQPANHSDFFNTHACFRQLSFLCFALAVHCEHEIVFTCVHLVASVADGADPPTVLVTSVTFEPARHTASILFRPGLLGMPPNGSKIRRGEAPQVGVACENPSLDWKRPTSLSEYAHIRFGFY